VIFDEGYVGGAAAEGFDADGAGAGEDVEEAGADYAGTEDVEERFAKAVAGGTEGEAFEAFEDAAAVFAGDDAHLEILEEEKKEKEGKGFIAEGRRDTEYAEMGNENGTGDASSKNLRGGNNWAVLDHSGSCRDFASAKKVLTVCVLSQYRRKTAVTASPPIMMRSTNRPRDQ